jgi:uroporphyrin-3 C-methyltransferase
MSDDTETTRAEPQPRKPRGRRIGLAGLAILVALIALAMAAWSVWRLQHASRAAQAARAQEQATIATLQNQLAAANQQTQTSGQRLGNLESSLDDLRTSAKGFDRRLSNLETAYATLSGQQQSGHDTLLLNDAELLLRTGQQRYELFHDTTGALKAYTQAGAVLQQIQNPAYAPVRANAATERDALAAAAPPARQDALDVLSALRGKVAALPLVPPATASSAAASKSGFWSHVGRAFDGIVQVSRDNGKTPLLTDARFARQALALELAQAQESLLAFDGGAYRAALQRADATLAAQFDAADTTVQDAHTQIAQLLAQHASGPAPKLGGALAELQSLRAGQSTPAPASTAGGAKP